MLSVDISRSDVKARTYNMRHPRNRIVSEKSDSTLSGQGSGEAMTSDLPLRVRPSDLPPLSVGNLSRLSGLTLAGEQSDIKVSKTPSVTTADPMDTPLGTPTVSAGASASSNGWETASENWDSVSEGTEEQDMSGPVGFKAHPLHLGAICVPQGGRIHHGSRKVDVTVSCKVIIPYNSTLRLEGNVVLEQSIEVGKCATMRLDGNMQSMGDVELDYNGKFQMEGTFHLFGSITLGKLGRLELSGNGTCGSAESMIEVGYNGRLLVSGNLEAKRIELDKCAKSELAGNLRCHGDVVLGYNAKILTFGNFKCKTSVDVDKLGMIEVRGDVYCERNVTLQYGSHFVVNGRGKWKGSIEVDKQGTFTVGQKASFGGTVKIGYGGRFKVCGDARFKGPVDLHPGGKISVKMGTIFPPGSVLEGSIKYL